MEKLSKGISEQEQKIINILGENHTDDVYFVNPKITIDTLYTYKNNVYIIKDGWEFGLHGLDLEEEINLIVKEIENKNYITAQ